MNQLEGKLVEMKLVPAQQDWNKKKIDEPSEEIQDNYDEMGAMESHVLTRRSLCFIEQYFRPVFVVTYRNTLASYSDKIFIVLEYSILICAHRKIMKPNIYVKCVIWLFVWNSDLFVWKNLSARILYFSWTRCWQWHCDGKIEDGPTRWEQWHKCV